MMGCASVGLFEIIGAKSKDVITGGEHSWGMAGPRSCNHIRQRQ
jgi:hypothetical protein